MTKDHHPMNGVQMDEAHSFTEDVPQEEVETYTTTTTTTAAT